MKEALTDSFPWLTQAIEHNMYKDSTLCSKSHFHSTDVRDYPESKTVKGPRGQDHSKGITGVTSHDVSVAADYTRRSIDRLFLTRLAKLKGEHPPVLPDAFISKIVRTQNMDTIRDAYPDTPQHPKSTRPFYNPALVKGKTAASGGHFMLRSLCKSPYSSIRALMRSGTHDQWHALRGVQTWMGLRLKFSVYPECLKYFKKCCPQFIPLLHPIPDDTETRNTHYRKRGEANLDLSTGMSSSCSTTWV